jgi:hypothetical protein
MGRTVRRVTKRAWPLRPSGVRRRRGRVLSVAPGRSIPRQGGYIVGRALGSQRNPVRLGESNAHHSFERVCLGLTLAGCVSKVMAVTEQFRSRSPMLWTDKSWLPNPRRIATRAAARRLAELLGEQPDGRVGYAMRGERSVVRRPGSKW